MPDSRYITPQSTIILRFDENTTIHADDVQFKLRGSLSGELAGVLYQTNIAHPFIIKPNNEFIPNEVITVTLLSEFLPEGQFTYQFQISSVIDQKKLNQQNLE
ncbi:hypothetical protein HQ585_10970, partial [candidate division KSB1 bacterium]|nr:hypothetical protein [candidate division KSB1 bacterium]